MIDTSIITKCDRSYIGLTIEVVKVEFQNIRLFTGPYLFSINPCNYEDLNSLRVKHFFLWDLIVLKSFKPSFFSCLKMQNFRLAIGISFSSTAII